MPAVEGTPPAPLLSAVVVVGRRRDRLSRCLAGFLTQDRLAETEMVLLDVAPEVPLPSSAHHPAVRHIPLPAGTNFAAARYLGVERAHSPIIAFLEEHAAPLPGWADALIRAHQGGWAAVGPRVACANPDSRVARLAFLMSYCRFADPIASGEMQLLPGHNSSYKREVLLGYGVVLGQLLRNDNLLLQRLRTDGHRLYLEASASVEHLNEGKLATMWYGYRLYNRQYGFLRARELHWTLARRLFYAAATPLVPFYFLVNLSRDLRRRGSPDLALLWRGFVQVYITQFACALGQATGLLFGAGASERLFTEYELMAERPFPGST
jgi:Glycosyl transferase family 2